MIDRNSRKATLWVSDSKPPDISDEFFLWQEPRWDKTKKNYHSIPDLVEENAERLRAEYLDWLHGLSQILVDGSTVTDLLAIRKGLSFWWMTIPSLHSLEVNSSIFTAVRLLVLDELAIHRSISEMKVVGADDCLAKILRVWASARKINLSFDGATSTTTLARRTHRAIPMLGAAWVAVMGIRRIRKRRRLDRNQGISGEIAFIDYFVAPNVQEISTGDFLRRYWGTLSTKYPKFFGRSIYMHVPITGASSVESKQVRALMAFSQAQNSEPHQLIGHQISVNAFCKSVWMYLSLARRLVRVNRVLSDQNQTPREIALWQSINVEKRNFFWGAESMLNCIWVNVFEELLEDRQHIPLGFYLFENQPWEFALITAWRNAGHGDLFGVSHTTMLPWDLRYFKGKQTMDARVKSNQMPSPTKILINGSLMHKAALKGHYPDEFLLQVESLRYESHPHKPATMCDSSKLKLLLLGDYSPRSTAHMLKTLTQSVSEITERFEIIFRPHPGNLNSNMHHDLGIEESTFRNIYEAINWADAVLCGSSSSSALDVVLSGQRPIVINSGQGFNCNPFNSTSYADCVSTPDGLRNILLNTFQAERTFVTPDETFVDTNSELPKWKFLLETLAVR